MSGSGVVTPLFAFCSGVRGLCVSVFLPCSSVTRSLLPCFLSFRVIPAVFLACVSMQSSSLLLCRLCLFRDFCFRLLLPLVVVCLVSFPPLHSRLSSFAFLFSCASVLWSILVLCVFYCRGFLWLSALRLRVPPIAARSRLLLLFLSRRSVSSTSLCLSRFRFVFISAALSRLRL